MLMSGPDPTTWIWGHTQLCAPSHELSRGPNCGDLLHQPVVNMNKPLLGGNVETLQRPIGKIPLCAFFLSCMSPAERNYLNGNFWGQDVYATSACWHHAPTTSYLVDHKLWPSTWHIPPQELGPKFSALITNENIPSPCPCVFSQLSRCLGWVQCMNLLTSLMLDRFIFRGLLCSRHWGRGLQYMLGWKKGPKSWLITSSPQPISQTLCRDIWRSQRCLSQRPWRRSWTKESCLCQFYACLLSARFPAPTLSDSVGYYSLDYLPGVIIV